MRKFCLFFLVLASFVALVGTECQAQPAIASEYSDTVVVTIDGDQEPVSVVRDIKNELMWYYVPSRLRIAMHGETPAFQFVQYQRKDPKNPEEFIEGGILTMAVNMTLPKDGVSQIQKALAKKYNNEAIRVAPLEMKDGTFHVYAPDAGGKLGTAAQYPKMAPSFPNAEVPIMITMDGLNSDVIAALTTGEGGIPVFVEFTYMGVTPKCGFKVTANYENAYKSVSTDSKLRASYNSWFYSVSTKVDVSTIRESLEKSSSIKVEAISGEAFKAEDIDRYLDPVLKSIMDEIAEAPEPTPEPPAKASEPGNRKAFLSVGFSFAMKDVKKVRKGTRVFEMNRQSQVERKTLIGGAIGVGNILAKVKDEKKREALRKKLYVKIGEGNWQKAFFLVPDVTGAEAGGVMSIDLEVGVVDKKGKFIKEVSKEAVKWVAPKDEDFSPWKDKKGNERNSLSFGLAEVYEKYGDKAAEELSFSMVKKITHKCGKKKSVFKVAQTFPIFSGDGVPNTPEDDVMPITFYPDLIESWAGDGGILRAINISTECKSFDGKSNKALKQTVTLTPNTEDPPVMLVPTKIKGDKPNPVKGSFKFILKKGKVEKKFKDLLDEWGTDVMFMDDDFMDTEEKK